MRLSRADSHGRILTAAVQLGTAAGSGALSFQGVADAAGVSKALVLYHFDGRAALLGAVVTLLGQVTAARMQVASESADPMEALRVLARDECERGETALLAALVLEREVPSEIVQASRVAREDGATELARSVLRSTGLTTRVPAAFIGRFLVRELDGLVLAAARSGLAGDALEAELDAVSLSLLGLGH